MMSSMKRIFAARPAVYAAVLTIFFSATARAGVPTEQVRQTTTEVLEILQKPELQGEAKDSQREDAVRAAVDKRFDWPAMCRRALGRHWRGKSEEQQEEFVELFGELLEEQYMNKVENYSGEEVVYKDEKTDDGYATVDVAILTDEGREIDVQYRMHKKDGKWLVYDIVIEGVSLVMNYRSQFNDILAGSSFAELLDKIRSKVEK